MKKLLIELLKKYYAQISEKWIDILLPLYKDKLTETQIQAFVYSSLNTFIDVIRKTDYKEADQFLISSYNLFSATNLNLLEISQIFSQGRFAVLNSIELEASAETDPVILLGFLDDLIEQIYARYGMLHQETKMKEIVLDRDRLASKLEFDQQYLKSILVSSDQAIMVVDENEKFIAWNKGAEKIFGYKEDEIIGKPSKVLFPAGEKYVKERDRIIEDARKIGYTSIVETERVKKNGEFITVRLSVSRLPSTTGEYVGRSIIIKDHTEYKRLQDQIMSEQLVNIKENIDRITRIVRELVDFSRPPSYETNIQDITDIVKTAIGIVKYDKRVRKVKFETDLKDFLPGVTIAADQILQVLVNILINALDAIAGNGTIIVKSRYDHENIYVEITDNGCGMDNLTLEKIFDPFFTTKEVGKGTGLGLSVSYGIIKRFNGEIKVSSTLNEGSVFTISLPIAET